MRSILLLLGLILSVSVRGAVTGSVASSIAAGDQVILVNTGQTYELTGVSSNNIGSAASYSNQTPTGTCILTVETGKSGSGNFSFKLSNGSYLAFTSSSTSSNNKLWTVSNPSTNDENKQVSWSVSFNESNEVTITNVYNTGRKLLFNSDRFCGYTSNQTAVKFFKLTGSGNTTDCTEPGTALSITSANTATIGTPLTLTSSGGNGGDITWSVTDGTGSATVSGSTLTPVTKGTVTVTATQAENIVNETTYCGAAPTRTITISKAAPAAIDGGLVDEITVGTTGVTSGNSYASFTNKSASNTGHSPAVYAGKIIRGGSSEPYTIQMNTIGNSNAGREIVSTTSGGLLKRVEVFWNSGTTASRKVAIYGANTAYSGSETAGTGTKIGEIEYSSGDVSDYVDVADSYKYVQIVAVGGALYLNQVNVTWVPLPTYAVGISSTGCELSVKEGTNDVSNGDTFEAGTELTVTNAASTGYENAELVIEKAEDNSDVTTSVLSGSTLTMPAYAINIVATATKKNYTVTLAATNGKIQVGGEDKTSISVAYGETAQLTAVANDGYAFNGWSSNSANVVLTDATVNPATITVTGEGTITANFISTTKFNPGFAWSDASAEAVKGQEASLPTLTTNPYSLTPTYVSTNTDVAEINDAGEVTIKAVGSTTIKATYAEDATYADCEATYTLTVKGRVTWHIIKENSDETSSADYVKDAVPAKPVGVTSCDASSISLVGWTNATYAKSDYAPTPLYTENVPAVTDNADYYAVWGVSSADSEASISEGVDTDGIINESGWTIGGTGMDTYSGHGLKFTKVDDYLQSPDISSENLKSVAVKFRAGANGSTGSIFTIASYDDSDELIDSKTCTPAINYNDQNDYSYTLSGSATIAYVKITLTTRTVNVGMEYAELFKIIPGSTSGYTTNCVPPMTVATPTFTPDGSAAYYTEAQTVTITCATVGATIYYSLDGSEPSTAYTTPIEIDETKTLKAKAVLEDVSSEIAEATFTINLPVSTIQALQSHANGDLDFKFENILVTAVTSEKQAFISDGTYGAIIYINAGHGLSEGDLINSKSGTAYTTTLTKYNGAAELTVFDAESDKLTITNGQTIPVQNKTIDALSVANIGMIVDLGNLTYDATDKKFIDASSNEIAYYDAYKLNLTLDDGAVYAVKGLVNRYNETLQISPRSAEDLVKQTAKEAATGQWYVSSSKETAINGTYTINEDAEFVPFFDTNSDGEKTYGSTNTSVATIEGGTLVITGAGTTVISCEVAESENYYAKAAVSFTLKVNAEGTGDASWVAATWASNNSITANTNFAGDYETIAIDENVSMTWAKVTSGASIPAYNNGDKEGRLYANTSLTFTASNSKQITSITFHFTPNYAGTISASEGTYSNAKWDGFATSVTFTNANGAGQARIKSIDIEYAQGVTSTLEIEDIELSMLVPAGQTIEYTSNRTSPTIVYSDYDDEVIAINNGVVTPVAVGQTTVKASIAAAAPYSSVVTTFKVVVKSGVEVEGNVVILAEKDGVWYAMTNTQGSANNSLAAIVVDYNPTYNKIFNLDPSKEASIIWKRTVDGANATFQDANDKYLTGGSSSTNLSVADAKCVWTKSDDNYLQGDRSFLYSTTNGYFRCYTPSTAGVTDMPVVTLSDDIFVTRADIRTGLSEGKWGTICPKQEVKYPAGAAFYQLTYMELNSDGSPYKFFFDEIAENASLEAGKPYLFIAEGEQIKGVKVDEPVADGDHAYNGFVGYTGSGKHISSDYDVYTEGATNYYGLQNNVFRLIYSTSSTNNILDERAYVEISPTRKPSTTALPMPAYSKRRLVVGAGAPAVTTGMDELNASEAPVKVMIDGQLFIIRGEKMYNANGQLVK